jgi:CDGSH-type Zn-finger protein
LTFNFLLFTFFKRGMLMSKKKIVISKDGPYQVSGNVPLRQETIAANKDGEAEKYIPGEPLPGGEFYSLCRCGLSGNMPLCDGSHTDGFDGTETAGNKKFEEMAEVYKGPKLDLADAEALCAQAGFCERSGNTWDQVDKSDDPGQKKLAI